jgi:hypothetical protein
MQGNAKRIDISHQSWDHFPTSPSTRHLPPYLSSVYSPFIMMNTHNHITPNELTNCSTPHPIFPSRFQSRAPN